MRRSPLWREFESGNSVPLRVLRFAAVGGGAAFLLFAAVLDLTWPQQIVVALMTMALAVWLNRSSKSYLVTLMLMLFSCVSTLRYGYWRVVHSGSFLAHRAVHGDLLDGCLVCLLLGAECYAFLTLLLGYLQTLWPLRRTPVPMPPAIEDWPAVDVLIPTVNEPLSLVRYTVLAALNMDWPADKLRVHILDDGGREEVR